MLIIGQHFVYELYFMIKSDPMNHARSAFLTVFSPYSLRQARESDYKWGKVLLFPCLNKGKKQDLTPAMRLPHRFFG